jgi:hypothetical protein
MAKRASILDVDYNPVGARLRTIVEPANDGLEDVSPAAERTPYAVPSPFAQPQQTSLMRDERRPTREIKDAYLRFRCSESERKKWHDISREITGEHNQLSHVLRSCLLLLENSYEQMKKVSPEMQRIKRPAVQDALGLALYEHRIAQLLFDAIKAAGRPKA